MLASGQFRMTLDSSVMNVSIATVAKDVGTTVLSEAGVPAKTGGAVVAGNAAARTRDRVHRRLHG